MAVSTADNVKATVDKAMGAIGDLATLPEVTIRIIEIVEDPKSTARDLHAVIKNDPALSVKVLKVVNSAFYGLPGQVASVDRAIILLGLSAVKNISIAASIARLFKGKRVSEQFSAADLWRHSVAVAVAARSLAKCSPHPVMSDEVFVAGLIHDIGTLVERQSFPDQFTEVIDRCSDGDGDFLEFEKEIIGADAGAPVREGDRPHLPRLASARPAAPRAGRVGGAKARYLGRLRSRLRQPERLHRRLQARVRHHPGALLPGPG